MKDDMVDAFGDASDAISSWQENYSDRINDVINSNDDLIENL
jgi:hypothetical protein